MNKKREKFSFALFYQKFGVFTLLVIIFLVAMLLNRNFIKINNLRNILKQMVLIAIIASGGCYVLICAQINIAYDGLIACLGCTSCLIMLKTGNPAFALIGTIVIGGCIGFAYGSFVTIFRVPGFIVGLAINSIASGTILIITHGNKIVGMDESYEILGNGSIGPIPINVIVAAVVMIICHIILAKSTFGRQVYAVGGNRQAAIASGIDADAVIRKVYILDGITTAVAGYLFMSRLGTGLPSAGKGYAFDAITGAVVGGASIYGGKGTIVGCLVGATIVTILDNILSLMNVNSYWQSVFSGSIILLAVLIDIATKEAAAVAIKNRMAAKTAE
ncbi:MAG: ABC transporter permease [Eubacteriales bacterium]|nr:ABC transporter permease [Eubacteriales bacterium]